MNPKLITALSVLLALAACGDDDKSPVAAETSSDAATPNVTATADAGVPVVAVGPGSSVTNGGTAPIPLLVWVDDLVDHHSTDDAIPDTVDDKNIVDDENPSAYDARF